MLDHSSLHEWLHVEDRVRIVRGARGLVLTYCMYTRSLRMVTMTSAGTVRSLTITR